MNVLYLYLNIRENLEEFSGYNIKGVVGMGIEESIWA